MKLQNTQQQTRNDQQTQHTAIVTGSTSGIGKETALLLLKNGNECNNILKQSRKCRSYGTRKYMKNFHLKKIIF